MTISNGYCSLAECKERLAVPAADTASDAMIEQIVTSVSRWIDGYTGRRFYPSAETRYYTPDDHEMLYIDDITAVTALKTDDDADDTFETLWTASDYYLLPYNAVAEGEPYTRIKISKNGDYIFPTLAKGVLLQATYGYATTTSSGKCTIVKDACLLQSARIYKRKDSPLGVAGMTALGVQTLKTPGLDPDVKSMLDPFRSLI